MPQHQAPYEIPVEAIDRFLLRDCNKARQYRMLPPYFVFMALLTSLLFLHRIDVATSETYTLQERAKNLLDYKNFLTNVEDAESFWKWFPNMTNNVFEEYRVHGRQPV